MNLITGLASLDEGDDPDDEDLRAEALAAGLDLDAWAEAITTRSVADHRADQEKADRDKATRERERADHEETTERERRARTQTTKLALLAGGVATATVAAAAVVALTLARRGVMADREPFVMRAPLRALSAAVHGLAAEPAEAPSRPATTDPGMDAGPPRASPVER